MREEIKEEAEKVFLYSFCCFCGKQQMRKGRTQKNTIEVVIGRKLIKKDDKYGGVERPHSSFVDDKGLNNNNCRNEDRGDRRRKERTALK